MTAITLTELRMPSRIASVQPARRRSARPAAARPSPLRLTRRGRFVLASLLGAAAIVTSMFLGGGISLAGSRAVHPQVRYVTVMPGQTLWAIAGEVAPQADRRDTVARILELNALPSSGLQAGQRIAVPVR